MPINERYEKQLIPAAEGLGVGVARRLFPRARPTRRPVDVFDFAVPSGRFVEAKGVRTFGASHVTVRQREALEAGAEVTFVFVAYDRKAAAALCALGLKALGAVARAVRYVLVADSELVKDAMCAGWVVRPDALLRTLLARSDTECRILWRLHARVRVKGGEAGAERVVVPCLPLVSASGVVVDLRTDRDRRSYGRVVAPF